MAINRNQFKRTEVSKVKDEARKAEKTPNTKWTG